MGVSKRQLVSRSAHDGRRLRMRVECVAIWLPSAEHVLPGLWKLQRRVGLSNSLESSAHWQGRLARLDVCLEEEKEAGGQRSDYQI